MLFVNEGYEDFEYVVSVSDNYVCLTDQPSASNETIDVIYQYNIPSHLVIEDTRTYGQYQSLVSFDRVETSTDFYDRGDCSLILIAGLCVTVLVCKVINMVTEFVSKDGII